MAASPYRPPRYLDVDELDAGSKHPLVSTKEVRSRHSPVVAGVIVMSLVIGSIVSLPFIPWVQNVRGQGRVIAYSPNDRQQQIEAPIDGRISHWYVPEGSFVKKGDPIVDLVDVDPQRYDRLRTERDAVRAKLTASEQALETSERNVARQLGLFDKGLSSRRTYELAQLEVAKFQSDLSAATAELARIETLLARQASQMVVAPRDGTIMRILTPQGGVFVKLGDVIAMLVPVTTDRAVELTVRGNDLPLVSVGRHVRLQFEGWPAIQFAGWPSVAVGSFGGTIGVIDASDDGSGNFRVIAFPDKNDPHGWPDGRFLRQGVRAVGWILLDEVSLGWELWRQFNGFPMSVQTAGYPGPSGKSGFK